MDDPQTFRDRILQAQTDDELADVVLDMVRAGIGLDDLLVPAGTCRCVRTLYVIATETAGLGLRYATLTLTTRTGVPLASVRPRRGSPDCSALDL